MIHYTLSLQGWGEKADLAKVQAAFEELVVALDGAGVTANGSLNGNDGDVPNSTINVHAADALEARNEKKAEHAAVKKAAAQTEAAEKATAEAETDKEKEAAAKKLEAAEKATVEADAKASADIAAAEAKAAEKAAAEAAKAEAPAEEAAATTETTDTTKK